VDKVGPGEKFQVSVVVEVEPGYHLNSHAPLIKTFIPTDLFTAGSPGLRFGRPEFPLGVLEKDAAGQQLSLYRDKVAIIVPVEVTGPLTGNSVEISGAVTYQACSDRTKMCFPPTAAEWRLELPVAGAAVQVAKGPELAGPAGASTSQPQETAHRSTVAESPQSEESRSSASVRAVPQAGQPARAASAGGTGVLGRLQALLASLGIVGYLIAAFVGGLIMNVMPCVLPVISIKVLSFVQQARESRLRVLTLGLAFAAGIQVSFILLGLLIMGLLKGVGFELQWGGQFQSPGIVIALAAVVTAFAMSLFGVFTLSPPRFVLEAGENVDQEGHVNAFGMGLLATVLGTACTAPFVSWVVAIAASQSSVAGGMLIFIVMGFGMALPYVLLAANPGWLQFIPRPGPWLKTFEHVMGFLLLGTVAFLLNPILHQLGGQGLLWTLVFLLFVAAAAWCYGQAGFGAGSVRQATCYSGAVLLVAFGWWLSFRYATRIPELVERQRAVLRGEGVAVRPEWKNPDEIPWVPYTRQRVDDFVRSGSTVFIDYTAEWCANCKANEALFINTPEVRQAMRQRGVVPIRADHTLTDPEIEADLERFNRAGVPMYVIIPAQRPGDAILLNEILTKGAIIEGLEKAGPSVGVGMATAAGGKEMERGRDRETERGGRGMERQGDKETGGGGGGG
jgi:thiol:disulfide interchange protein